MRFHGLFIGIDRFASPLVNELTCAARDAQALFSLFGDTLGGEHAVLLADEAATRAAIIEQLTTRLTEVSESDAVFISFSGHGSDDHYLVTHDADPNDLANTSIALDELVVLFSRIPARNLILVLDCCFSGGAGARVFHHAMPARSIHGPEQALAAIANEGRLILTASDPNQEAIEDPALGHGLLTWFLMEALRGAPEVVSEGRIHLYKLLHYVSRKVTDEAASVGHDQRPTFRGRVDGELLLPVFVAGREYSRRFPERVASPVTENVEDLAAHGIPSFVLNAWRSSIPTLNELQQSAVNHHGILAGRSIVVSAPTSSGKTMVGELAALRAYADRKRTLFLLPMRALVNDKYDEFSRKYGTLGIRIVRTTGELQDDVPSLLRGKYDICLMTYEKAAAILIAYAHVLRGVGTVVVDEVQMLADPTRGANLEFLLTLLKYRRREGVRPQIVLLSAVIGDTNGLERWLTASLLRSEKRPVPLKEGILRADGSFRFLDEGGNESVVPCIIPEFRKGTGQDYIVPLTRKLVEDEESVIIFRETKPETRKVAAYLGRELSLPPAESVIAKLPEGDLSRSSSELRSRLAEGVAFHNADLDREERRVIETAFREGEGIHVLVGTTTIAMGVNTPASSVIIRGLEHPGGTPYTVAEYKNMVGRAGRYGFASAGKSYLVCISAAEEWKFWHDYIQGRPEPLASRFLDADPLILILRVLATADVSRVSHMTEEQIVGFLESSFGAHQRAQRPGVRGLDTAAYRGAFERLRTHGLISHKDGCFGLTELGRVAGESGIAVESVLRVVEAVQGLSSDRIDEWLLLSLAHLTCELDDVYFPTHKKSHKEKSRWESTLRSRVHIPYVVAAILSGSQAAHRAKKFAATAYWVAGTEMQQIEAALAQHYPGDYGGPIRAVAERARDVLGPIAKIVSIIIGDPKELLGARADRLAVQLEIGVPRRAVPLARAMGRRLTRGDYLRLVAAGLINADGIGKASDEYIAELLRDESRVRALREVQALLAQEVTDESLSDERLLVADFDE
ncbi:DEAD/DEAH box helicase [Sorangium sp. So ce128]|uniref:DEAD/DEAH box helicase n=1 Tax=Sorangium sp. So ce128 TaxID=3133281 RepID=UPI003F5E7548